MKAGATGMAAGATGMDKGMQLSILLPTLHLDTVSSCYGHGKEEVALRGNHREK